MKKLAFLKSVQEKSVSSLMKEISSLRKEYQTILINLKLGKERNHRKLSAIRQNIARTFTIANQKIKK